jgi:hypothetical protein
MSGIIGVWAIQELYGRFSQSIGDYLELSAEKPETKLLHQLIKQKPPRLASDSLILEVFS